MAGRRAERMKAVGYKKKKRKKKETGRRQDSAPTAISSSVTGKKEPIYFLGSSSALLLTRSFLQWYCTRLLATLVELHLYHVIISRDCCCCWLQLSTLFSPPFDKMLHRRRRRRRGDMQGKYWGIKKRGRKKAMAAAIRSFLVTMAKRILSVSILVPLDYQSSTSWTLFIFLWLKTKFDLE